MSRTVTVNDEPGAVDILKDYIGHTLKGVRVSDGTHVEQMEPEILLEFEEAAHDHLLTIEEQESFFKACKQWAVDGQDTEFRQPCRDVIRRLFSDAGAV